ncbi:MAG: serine/threonine-protein phosphatase, partial [Rhizobacter sp.]|nr:serine/threonine-protein phosphatase [Rhizobacter sp.]
VTHRCALVQAGHPAPFYAGSPQAPFMPLGDGGLPIGVLADAEFEALTVSFAPGARLVLYSDGITDCRNADDEAFGEDRLRNLLATQDGAELAGKGPVLHQALRAWCSKQGFEDDVTFLSLEVR